MAAPRILVVRLSAIGDVVMASGLIPALRARWPDAHLAWLTQPLTVPLLRYNPRLDQVLVWPREHWQQLWRERRWGELWRALREFHRLLREQRFDLVLDAQGLLKSAVCAWLTGAPRRVALYGREGGRLLVHEVVQPSDAAAPRVGHEYRHLVRHVGAPETAFAMDLVVGAEARSAVHLILQAAGVTGPYVALCPFTTRAQKHWFEDHWVALAQRLGEHGLTPVLLGGPGDVAAAARITAACPRLVSLAGRVKLDQNVAAVAGASLLVGVDTGLTHMGTALGVPSVALFGSTRTYLDACTPRTVVMYDALPCSPCHRHPTCAGRFDCMRSLSVERVAAQALQLLDRAV